MAKLEKRPSCDAKLTQKQMRRESLRFDWKSSTGPLFLNFHMLRIIWCMLVGVISFFSLYYYFFFCQNDLLFLWSFSLPFSYYFRVTRKEKKGGFVWLFVFLLRVCARLLNPYFLTLFLFFLIFFFVLTDQLVILCVLRVYVLMVTCETWSHRPARL